MVPSPVQPVRPLPLWTAPFILAALIVVVVCAAVRVVALSVGAVLEAV